MNNQNYTNRNHPATPMREVSLPRLLLLTLRHWRSMFLFGLILAVLLAGMKVLREYKNRGVSNVAHEEYLAAMEIYNASVEAYSRAIEKFQTKIDNKQKYFNESLLMQIDPHNECVSTISMVVKTPGLEKADTSAAQAGQTQSPAIVNASNVVHAYTDFISSGISFDKIAAEAGVTEQSVRELVLVTTDQYHFSSVFKVQARSMDMDLSKKIMDHILEEIDKNRDAFKSTLGEYDLELVSRSEETAVDTALLQQQTELQNSIATLQKNLQTSQTSLKELIKPTEATGASMKTILKNGIKYGIVGMAGGIFLMVLFWAVRILLSGKILTDDEINVGYGLRNLMTFSAGATGRRKRFPVDRLVDKIISGAPSMPFVSACDVLIARVEALTDPGESCNVILVSSLGGNRIDNLARTMSSRAREAGVNVTFEASKDLEKNASAIRALRNANACVVVERVGESVYRTSAEEVELLLASGKEILGTVYL